MPTAPNPSSIPPREPNNGGLGLITEPTTQLALEDSRNRLEQERLFSQNRRDESIKNALNRVFVWLIWAGFLGFFAVLMIRMAHLILPQHLQWLTPDQIQNIDKIIFSGAIGGFVGRYFKRYDEVK